MNILGNSIKELRKTKKLTQKNLGANLYQPFSALIKHKKNLKSVPLVAKIL